MPCFMRKNGISEFDLGFQKIKKLQKLQFLQPRILMDQCLKFPKAESDRGIWSHILVFPVDRVAGSRWRRIEE